MSMNKMYAVFGLGRYGIAVARELVSNGMEVIAVDTEQRIVNDAAAYLPVCKCADVTDAEVISRLGIGNIDICVTELDALANIDFETRQVKENFRQLTLVRLGTSGAIQPDIEVGEVIFSRTSLGFDGLLSYYEGRDGVCDLDLERAFEEHTSWYAKLPAPYFVNADKELFELFKDSTREGITIAAPGFYAPQGRWVRLAPHDLKLNEKIESFSYGERRITNFEMESSALAGMSALLGHKAMTVCAIIAGRVSHNMNTEYKGSIEGLIKIVLERI